ncbi:MAG: histidine kinase [Arcanobacterium sp.]|nr:histidine kinase [Arcanobacterium sp.]
MGLKVNDTDARTHTVAPRKLRDRQLCSGHGAKGASGVWYALSHWYARVSLRQLMLSVGAVVTVLLEVVVHFSNPPYAPAWFLIVLGVVCIGVYVGIPRVGQWLLVAVLVLFAFPFTTIQVPQMMQVLIGVALCADSVIRKDLLPAWCSVMATALTSALAHDGSAFGLVWAVIDVAVMVLSTAARKIIEEREAVHEELLQIERQTERQLAGKIHDTAARDLSRILIQIEQLKASSPDQQVHSLQVVERELRDALCTLRSLIGTLEGTLQQPAISITQAISQLHKELSSAGLEMAISLPENADTVAGARTSLVVDVLSELAVNALKYSEPNTTVDFSVSIDGDLLVIEESNKIRLSALAALGPLDSAAVSDELRGGTGLRRLSYRLGNAGGSLSEQIIGEIWVVQVVVPLACKTDTQVQAIMRKEACNGTAE